MGVKLQEEHSGHSVWGLNHSSSNAAWLGLNSTMGDTSSLISCEKPVQCQPSLAKLLYYIIRNHNSS